jgi:predicted SAM-dependent methyltransferase
MSTNVNIGCGLWAGKNWINLDGSWNSWFANRPILARIVSPMIGAGWKAWPRGIMFANISGGRIPLKSDCADFIFTGHFVEHLTRDEAQVFVGECLRILKPGGVLRIIVPNLEGAARKYLRDLDKLLQEAPALDLCPADAFISNISMCSPRRRWWRLMDWYQICFDYHRHFWMYDRQSLATAIALGGFESVTVDRKLQDSEIPFLSEVEREGALGADGGGFALEARKPITAQLAR